MRRQAWILLCTAILFGFVVIAYQNSNDDGKEAFSYELSVLDQLRFLNAKIDREVLLLISQKRISYDNLTRTSNELVRTTNGLASELFQDEVMENQVITKADAIESFKSRLSVLRNSVNAVVENLTRTSEEDFDPAFRRLEESLLKLSFSLDSNVTSELEALILEGEKTGSASDEVMYRHTTLILDSLRRVDALSQSIVNSAVSESIHRNRAVSSEKYTQRSEVAEAWRVVLFGAAIGLLCLLSLSVWMVLRRSSELRHLNRDLEARVEARTKALQETVGQKEEQEKLLRATLDSMDSHIAILNHKGTIIETNLAWENFAKRNGGDESCTVGSNYLESCENAADDSARLAKTAIENIISGKDRYNQMDYECSTPELELWFQARMSPVDFGSGSIGCVVSHMDITQRVFSEQESKLLSLVAKYTDNAVVITDAIGRIRWVNEGYTRVTGFDLEASLGQKPGDLLQG
ncbi:MAG: DAHL domain-containing protein, partial [Pseudomonadota bacterium]